MTIPSLSVAFATSPTSADDIVVAEELGYAAAWLYDTPQQSPDVWMALTEAALKTSRIGLGPGVLVPSLRHPMVNAAATQTLQRLAPGRVSVAFGTGFTGRNAMGSRALSWSYMRDYISAYSGLLRGEVVTWEGAQMQMMPPELSPETAPAPPPLYIGAMGPKGAEHAHALGADGIFVMGAPTAAMAEFAHSILLTSGTVLEPDEPSDSDRVRATAGPAWALAYHFGYEQGGAEAIAGLPGGAAWTEVIERHPEGERHLATHRGHLVRLHDADHAAWEAGGSAMVPLVTLTGPASTIAETVRQVGAAGIAALSFQPCGPDLHTEMERFINAARSS